MVDIGKILPRYLKILQGKEKAKFLIAREKGLLDKEIREAFKILENCELCERKCHVNRLKGEKGWCQITNKILVSSYFDHYGEEFFLVPSFTIFFWSCTFACVYCQNWSISQRYELLRETSEQELAYIIDRYNYCKNVNFVGGEPTPQLPFILETLNYVESNIPVVWNSNFYMSKKSMNLLRDVVDIYLSDFKYGNDKCAKRLSNVSNYTEIIKRNHLLAAKDAEVVIRHLVLPNHSECCSKPILRWIAQNLRERAIVNIMNQYRLEYKAIQHKDIARFVNAKEFIDILNYAKKLKINFIT